MSAWSAFFLGAFMAWTWAGVRVVRIVGAAHLARGWTWHYLWAVPGWPFVVERIAEKAAKTPE